MNLMTAFWLHKVDYNATKHMKALTIFLEIGFNSLRTKLANLESSHQARNKFLGFLSSNLPIFGPSLRTFLLPTNDKERMYLKEIRKTIYTSWKRYAWTKYNVLGPKTMYINQRTKTLFIDHRQCCRGYEARWFTKVLEGGPLVKGQYELVKT